MFIARRWISISRREKLNGHARLENRWGSRQQIHWTKRRAPQYMTADSKLARRLKSSDIGMATLSSKPAVCASWQRCNSSLSAVGFSRASRSTAICVACSKSRWLFTSAIRADRIMATSLSIRINIWFEIFRIAKFDDGTGIYQYGSRSKNLGCSKWDGVPRSRGSTKVMLQ